MTSGTPRALLFDFDGLILDTETPEFRAWQELFAAYGGELTTADWAHVIGSMHSGWDPAVALGRQTGRTFDREELRAEWKPRQVELLRLETIRPGVLELLKESGCAASGSASRRAHRVGGCAATWSGSAS